MGSTIELSDKSETAAAILQRGQELGRYLVLEQVGAGGMGVVYAAYDPELDRRLAIKVVSTTTDDHSRARFRTQQLLREGRVLARLVHPNVVTIHDIGRLGEDVFIAMEFVQGQTLNAWIAEQSPSADQILARCVAAGRGLAAAHREGLVHGDFKPTNVMVAADGRVVVLDFGLARAVASDDPGDSLLMTTARGAGTPAYMAPEQHEGLDPEPASDQFSFCVTLYEALCGRRPFEGQDRGIDEARTRADELREPSDAMPAWVWKVVRRGLAIDPQQRHPSFDQLLDQLDPAGRRQRRRLGWVGAAAALLASAAVGTSLMTPGPCDDPHAAIRETWDASIRAPLDERWAQHPSWPYVRDRLDRVASEWEAHWSRACRATHDDKTQSAELLDRRLVCLDGYRGQLDAFIDRLQEAEATDDTLARLAMRVGSLDPGTPCDDARAVLARAPPPADPQARQTFDQLIAEARDWSTRADADRYGRPSEAWEALEALLARAEALDHPHALRWVWQGRANVLEVLGRDEEAADAYAHALRHAEVAGDDVAAMSLASALIHVHASRLDDYPGARVWSEIAEGKLARVGTVPPAEQVGLRIHQATLARRDGHPEVAVERLEWALEQAEDDKAQRGTIHHNLGLAHWTLREHDRAVDDFRRAIELRTQALGVDHVVVAQSKYHLAQALAAQGETRRAYEILEEAIQIFTSAEGVERERITALAARAIFAATEGRLDEAIEMSEKTLQDAIVALGPDDAEVSTQRFNLARMLMMRGRYDEATRAAELTLAQQERQHGLRHPGLYMELSLLAELSLHRDDPQASLRYLSRARTLAPPLARAIQLEASVIYTQLHIDCDLAAARRALDDLLDEHREGDEASPGLDQLSTELMDEGQRWGAELWPTACAPLSAPSPTDPGPPPAPER